MPNRRIRALVLVPLFTAALAAAARLTLPLGPVPLTLQTLVVLLAGGVLGPWAGAGSVLLYLALGLAGLPLFSAGGGPAYLVNPAFGFLLSFPLAAAVTGLLLGKGDPTPARRALALFCGTAVVYAVGVPWLGLNLAWMQGKPLPWDRVLGLGMLPFLPGDIIKGAVAFVLIPPLRRVLGAGAQEGAPS